MLERAIAEFNEQKYYDCHDTLEELWMNSSEPHKTFYQGILQIAVGCYHLSNNNGRGAMILLGEGIRKLREYEPEYEQINITDLVTQSYDLLIALQSINQEDISSFYQQLINPNLSTDLTLPKITLN